MKTSTFLGFQIFVLIAISGCRDTNLKTNSNDPATGIAVMDSLTILDSLAARYKVTDNALARIYSQKSMALAHSANSGVALARAFFCMGMTYKYFDKDSCFYYYSIALRFARENNLDKIRARTMYNMATLYSELSAHKMAITYLDSAITISRRIGDYGTLSNAYNALGNLKIELADHTGAKIMYDSAYKVARRFSLPKQTGVAIASLSRFEGDPSVHKSMLTQALGFLEKQPGNEEEMSSILNNLGFYSAMPDSAIAYYKKAITIARYGKLTEVEVSSYNNMAYGYLDKNDLTNAEDCLKNNAIPLALADHNYDWLATVYDSYADVLTVAKRTDEALHYSRLALKNRVYAFKKIGAEQVRLLSTLLDVKNKELKLEMNAKEIRQKENNNRLIIFWFSISIMILLVIIFIVILKGQRNKIRFQLELIGSAKKLINLEEVMKGRVAMELHDLTTPFYFTMLQQIENAKITDSGIADDMKSKVSVMAKNIREISHRMNNDFIGQMTIQELVNGLSDNLKEATNVPMHCVIGPGEFNLSKEETIHIYRIIQELLTNAIKYVSSGEINLSLTMEEGMLFILYHDSGPGFNMQAPGTKGLGILNIFERAKIIHGKAVLNSSPGSGTRWTISMPHHQVAG